MVTLLCHSCNVTQRNSCKTNRSNKKKKHTKVFTIFILIFQKYNVKIRIDDVSRCYFFHQWGKCMKLNNFEHFLTNNHGIRQMYIIKRMERVFKQDILFKTSTSNKFCEYIYFSSSRSFFSFFFSPPFADQQSVISRYISSSSF